jgi:integrase
VKTDTAACSTTQTRSGEYRRAGRDRLLVYVLAYCGLRLGEATGLQVADVDTGRRRVRVERSVTDVDGHLVHGTPKNHQAREVPVPAFLVALVVEAIAGRPADAPLFPAPGGGLLRGNNFRRRSFDRAAASVGLPGLTPHELRHTAASLAVSAGANVKAVQLMLGHASAAMTLDVYAGLFGDDLDTVADRLDVTGRAAAADQVDAAAREAAADQVRTDDPEEDDDDGSSGALVPA